MGSIPHGRDHGGGDHPVPFRTRQLSPPSPRVLRWSPWEGRESRPWGMLRVLRGVLREEGRRGAHASMRRGRRPFSFGAFWVLYVALALYGFGPVWGSFCFRGFGILGSEAGLGTKLSGFRCALSKRVRFAEPRSSDSILSAVPTLDSQLLVVIDNFWLRIGGGGGQYDTRFFFLYVTFPVSSVS